MKFANYLKSIHDVSIFSITAVVLFFVFFVLVCLYVFTRGRDYVQECSNLPLEDGTLKD